MQSPSKNGLNPPIFPSPAKIVNPSQLPLCQAKMFHLLWNFVDIFQVPPCWRRECYHDPVLSAAMSGYVSACLYIYQWKPLGDLFSSTRGSSLYRWLSDLSWNWFSYDLTKDAQYPLVRFVLWWWNEIFVINNKRKMDE